MKDDNASKKPSSVKALEKVPTHIPGLDEILAGGLPRGRTTVIKGGAGSGKTLMGMEFLFRGALAGEPGIFVGFEEPAERIRENAATLGWDLAELERENRLFLLEGQITPDILLSGDFSLKGLLAAASGKSNEMGAKCIVIDALEVVLRLFESPKQVRNEIHALNDWLHASGLSVILTVRPSSWEGTSAYEDFFDSMADCVIKMGTRISDQVSTRRLQVIKYRGSGFGRNEHPYVITQAGMHTAPISTASLQHKPQGEKVTTGNTRFDDMLDGGYLRRACLLIAGMPGTGKTILASTFVAGCCGRGETVLYIGFEESEASLIRNVLNAGVTLKPHIDSGRLSFSTCFPESMGADEHYIHFLNRINLLNPQHVVIDAISACNRMGGKQAAFEYLMRLFNICKERGITLLMVNQLVGTTSFLEISGNGISSMVDTVIYLNYHEGFGETNRLIEVLKSRGCRHSNQKREYAITDDGFKIMDVFLGKGEVLTGIAREQQDFLAESEAQLLNYKIDALELELKKKLQLRKKASMNIKHRGTSRGTKNDIKSNSSKVREPSAPATSGRRDDP